MSLPDLLHKFNGLDKQFTFKQRSLVRIDMTISIYVPFMEVLFF